MIELPTRRRLERRRERLYAHLHFILSNASIIQVENIMRQIHGINIRLRTYFKGGIDRQPQELFNQEDNVTTQDTTQREVNPTAEELAKIEVQIQTGKI
jgi:hypothetical protein